MQDFACASHQSASQHAQCHACAPLLRICLLECFYANPVCKWFPAHPPDAGVQVTPPAPHALLVCTAIAVASDLCPAPHTKGLDKLNQLCILVSRPLVAPNVGIDLNMITSRMKQVQGSKTACAGLLPVIGGTQAASRLTTQYNSTTVRCCTSKMSLLSSTRLIGCTVTLCRQRWAHCCPVLPGMCLATSDHLLPTLLCATGSGECNHQQQGKRGSNMPHGLHAGGHGQPVFPMGVCSHPSCPCSCPTAGIPVIMVPYCNTSS
jgi:hypothetical protein